MFHRFQIGNCFQNKSKKTIEKIENFSKVKKINNQNELEIQKNPKKMSFKKKKFYKKKFRKRKN